jgi:ATP-dependent 26S proteasome regulatory subunit
MTTMPGSTIQNDWAVANAENLAGELDRLRLLLHRRILWLRKNWRRTSTPGYADWAISDNEANLLLAGNDPGDERDFYASDEEAQSVSKSLAEVSSQLLVRRGQLWAAGTPVAIDVLTARFGLSPFERDVVLLCVAPELDPRFERLYAYVQDDATRKYPTPLLALHLFSSDERSGQEHISFLPGGALNRWRLVTSETKSAGAFISRPLRMDTRLVDYLSGFNRLDERCCDALRLVPRLPLPSCHDDFAERLAQWIFSETQRPKLLNLVGQWDSGRLAIAQAVCARAELNFALLDLHILHAARDERREMIALLERESVLSNLVVYLESDSPKPEETPVLRAWLEQFSAPVILASRDRFSCERDTLAVNVERPDAASQTELWKQALGESAIGLNGELHAIVEQFDFGPCGIARAAQLASNNAALRKPGEVTINNEDLWRACRQETTGQLDQLVHKIEPCYDWDDIVVPADVLCQLREITDQVAHRRQVYQQWGFGKKLRRGRGIGALFCGPSGVGKTMAAEVMARHLSLDLHRVDLAGVVSKYVGETEKNLRCVFDTAERCGAILLFDEADALFGKRFEAKDGHDRYANIEINYLLQRMEDYRGLAILATNMKSALDHAFLRRLRFIVDFPFPDAAQRLEIWHKVFPAPAEVDGLDFHALSRLEITGANIRNIALSAAFLAAAEKSSIRMEHAMRAARREYTKIDRLVMDTEFGHFAAVRTP